MQQRHLIQPPRPKRVPSAASRRRKRLRLMMAALGAALTASVLTRA